MSITFFLIKGGRGAKSAVRNTGRGQDRKGHAGRAGGGCSWFKSLSHFLGREGGVEYLADNHIFIFFIDLNMNLIYRNIFYISRIFIFDDIFLYYEEDRSIYKKVNIIFNYLKK